MKRKNRWRWILLGVFFVLSVWYLTPTFLYYSYKKNPGKQEKAQEYLKKALKLGLDLQGGVRMLLEVDMPSLVEQLAANKDERYDKLIATVTAASSKPENTDKDFITLFMEEAHSQNLPLDMYYDRDRRRDERNNVRDVEQYLRDEANRGVDQALEIIRNRVDQFGVAEPSIQKQGEHRISVELAGIDDKKRAQDLVGKTAKLEFKLLKSEDLANQVYNSFDRILLKSRGVNDSTIAAFDTAKIAQTPSTQTKKKLSEILGNRDTLRVGPDKLKDFTVTVDEKILKERPFRALMADISYYKGWYGVPEENIPAIKWLLEQEDFKKALPSDAAFYWEAKPIILSDGNNYFELLLLERDAVLAGDVVTDARVVIGQGYDPKTAGKPVVSMEMNKFGAKEWALITGANINKRVAIVLDDQVFSAPVVQGKIPDGHSQIEGMSDMNEAKILEIVLRSGAFKANMNTISASTVGASLGVDSVRKGALASILGFCAVALFMILYYRTAGILAVIALFLNVLFLLAVMSGFHATLTMPGIAGFILTVGMAVDANVLIYERIREELATGKTVRASIDLGYSRAFTTILDSNLTTLIAGVVLYQYGTGPVRGFAIVLSVGIVSSMFTAIVVTRVIFDYITSRWNLQKLSI
jgi:preprotein translocase subunit SecD